MRKILVFILSAFIFICQSDATVRDTNTISRAKTNSTTGRSAAKTLQTSSRSATVNTVKRNESNRINSTISRSASAIKANTISSRSAAPSLKQVSRSAVSLQQNKATTARAAVNTNSNSTFGTGYNACRDSYFTCMDQFCANKDETYRRCICSSRLIEIQNQENAIAEVSDQLNNFQDLNIESIDKTGNEVKAMISASTGEQAAENTKDTSDSANKLAGISDVLNSTKTNALSTGGKLDIAGDINAIWTTTDIASGSDIANLTGEKLYNAVNKQCEELVADTCGSQQVLDMVISAYGMYIENDCSNLSNSLASKKVEASSSIRQTEYAMNDARLENYNAHNSESINSCISLVREDITDDTACGEDYVHCLDVTGQYLNQDTGEPIYSSDFYQLELLTSVSGDVLKNQTNRLLIAELERKKEFAAGNLDTCRDIADEVWDEFLRQAIVTIYQGQQEKIRQVKNECIDVVTNCYDTKNNSLKDFSDIKEQLLLGARMELSEEMCITKLDTCSNLYGGGESGLSELISTMTEITNQTIGQNCKTTLEEYLSELCAVPSKDTVHNYPFSCRVYTPGDQKYVSQTCNAIKKSGLDFPDVNYDDDVLFSDNMNLNINLSFCSNGITIMYTNCNYGYYMTFGGTYNSTPVPGNACSQCPEHYVCNGGTDAPYELETDTECGDYPGSLYQKLVNYALQACVRPSESTEDIPTEILEDVNTVMDTVKVNMATELSDECERLGGVWVDTPGIAFDEDGYDIDLIEQAGDTAYETFYDENSANKKWGYCRYTDECSDINFAITEDACTGTIDEGAQGGCVSLGCKCDSTHYVSSGTCSSTEP